MIAEISVVAGLCLFGVGAICGVVGTLVAAFAFGGGEPTAPTVSRPERYIDAETLRRASERNKSEN